MKILFYLQTATSLVGALTEHVPFIANHATFLVDVRRVVIIQVTIVNNHEHVSEYD